MKILKALVIFGIVGKKLIDAVKAVINFADRVIHRKEYKRRAKARKRFWTILLSVTGGILLVLFFPYRVIVKKNGDFEFRSLLLRVYRRTEEYDIPEGGSEEFDIEGVADADEGDLTIE